ncbi:leucine-rich repeat domain-containing protein [Listeria booriae]|uniref:Leucine-rich repeat domain-containing protein n=1 Tax=Listeria booriae TaxID=1552123 RepID=A0A842B1T6_9LIST|nr:leucine-rich repeat domain-containing protein [Listeria booriae]MBC1796871.1 leucine-rich repeat domain-containing protein [Listeria booriae]
MLKKCTISALAVLVTLSSPASMIAQANTVPTQSQESQTNKLMQAKQGGVQQVQASTVSLPAKISEVFPDTKLATAIAGTLGKAVSDTVTQADFDRITSINYYGKGITNLTGMEYLQNLDTAFLSTNNISNVLPLGNLTKLKTLELHTNKITDVSGLSDLVNLESLHLASNQISDISSLNKLTKLKSLYLHNQTVSYIQDISVLANMPDLTTLYGYGNKILDISPLEGLTKLTTVKLNNQIANTLPEVEDNLVNDSFSITNPTKGIAGMTASMSGTNVSFANDKITWSNQTGATGSVGVNFNYAGKNGWTFSGTLTQPWIKSVSMGAISTIFPDAKLATAIAGTLGKAVSDTVTQADLDVITSISYNNMGIKDLTGMEHLKNLDTAYLCTNAISDLSPLKNLTKLKTLEVHTNKITDVSELSDLVSLESLHLASNQISDISSLNKLTKLKSLYLHNQTAGYIQDISVLANMPDLTTLYGYGNKILDISPLEGLTKLTIVKLNSQLPLILPELEDNVTGNILSVDNPIVGVTGMTPTFSGTDVSFDSAANKIKWSNRHLPGTNTITATFNYTGKPGWTFGGSVSQTYTRAPSLGTIADVFPDPNLANIIATTLGKQVTDTVTHLDLETITDLDASDKGIHELTGMEKLTNLATTQLDGNNITDITPLLNLTQLTSVDITNQTVVFELVIEPLTNGILSVPNILQLPTGANLEVNGADVSYDSATNKVAWANVTAEIGDLEASFTMNDLPTGWSYSGLIQQAYEKDSLTLAEEEVARLFKDSQKKELASGITDVDIRQADEAVEGLANEADKVPLRADVILAWDLLHNGKATAAVNALFTNEDPTQDIKDDLVQTDIDNAQALVDAINDSHSADVKTDLQTKVAKAQAQLTAKKEEAEAQVAAEEAVYRLFENNDPLKTHLKDNTTQAAIDDAQALVDGLKDSPVKAVLHQELNRVNILFDAELAREALARETVNALFINQDPAGLLRPDATQADLDTAQTVVDEVLFSSAKAILQTDLNQAYQTYVLAVPEVAPITNASTTVTGKGIAGNTIIVKIGNDEYRETIRTDGTFTVLIPETQADTMVQVYQENAFGSKSLEVSIKVSNYMPSEAPVVNEVYPNQVNVTGTVPAGTKIVRLLVNGVAQRLVEPDVQGHFSIYSRFYSDGTVSNLRLKAGDKVTVDYGVRSTASQKTTVTVQSGAMKPQIDPVVAEATYVTGKVPVGTTTLRLTINGVSQRTIGAVNNLADLTVGGIDPNGNFRIYSRIIVGVDGKSCKLKDGDVVTIDAGIQAGGTDSTVIVGQ